MQTSDFEKFAGLQTVDASTGPDTPAPTPQKQTEEVIQTAAQETTETEPDDVDTYDDDAEQNPKNTNEPVIPRKAFISLRKEKQRLAEELAAHKARMQVLEEIRASNAQQLKQPEKDPYEIEEGEEFSDLRGTLDKVKKGLLSEFAKRERLQRFTQSEVYARDRYDDWEDVVEKNYKDAVKDNPALAQIVDHDPAPALRAYKETKKFLARKQAENVDPQAFEKRVEEEVAKRLASYEQKSGAVAAARIPKSLASNGAGIGPGLASEIEDQEATFSSIFAKKGRQARA